MRATKIRRWIAALGIGYFVAALDPGRGNGRPAEAVSNEPTTQPAAPSIRDLGVPVRSVNWVRLHAGRDQQGRPCLYATMGQQADNFFVLQIDPETGKCRQFVAGAAGSNYPTATLMSRTGRLYVGAAYAGHLFRFDPDKDRLEDLGAIHRGAATFPCRLDEDAQGRIWIGSYGTADLTCYDPRTTTFTHHGRMDDVDMYNYPLVNADGTVACLIRMTRPHIVVFDPATGAKQVVGPVTTKGEETLDLHKGNDGRLYIRSSAGQFRIEGMKAVAVNDVPDSPPDPALPDGSAFAFADADEQLYRRLEIRKPDGATRSFELDYEARGTEIFYIHHGPDGLIYGSSILPEHLFRYNPATDELVDLGRCSLSTGEAYSMANLGGKIYIASYPAARISEYDPRRPYRFGEKAGDNPRDLGRIDVLSYRPRSTLAGPLGRVWTASLPDYGTWGGPLSWIDPATGERKAYHRTFGDGSCYTLAHLDKEKLIAVGTSIAGGSGTQPKVDQAALLLWDYQSEKKLWEGTPDRPVSVFNALTVAPDGRLFGTVRGGGAPPEMFVFDPRSRTFTARIALPGGDPLDLGLQNGPDGKLYGFTRSVIYRVDPASLATEVVLRADGAFGVAGPIVGDRVYFATGHRLRCAKIF